MSHNRAHGHAGPGDDRVSVSRFWILDDQAFKGLGRVYCSLGLEEGLSIGLNLKKLSGCLMHSLRQERHDCKPGQGWPGYIPAKSVPITELQPIAHLRVRLGVERRPIDWYLTLLVSLVTRLLFRHPPPGRLTDPAYEYARLLD